MNDKPKHVVIVGMSRSGTTLLYSLMANALKNYKFHEKETHALSLKPSTNTLSKRPLDCLSLDQIFQLNDRDVRVIFCVRDPRDVICSVHKDVPHDYFIGFSNQYFVVPHNGICQLTAPGLLQITQSYLQYKDKVLCLKYEQLTESPNTTLAKINAFIDENMLESDFSLTETSQVPRGVIAALNGVRPIDAKGVGQWKKHPWRVWNEFSHHAGMHEIMKVFGYEDNKAWFIEHFEKMLPVSIIK